MKDLHSTKQLTPEQFGPGLVSTSCISLEATSAVLAEKLSDVRIAFAAMRFKAINRINLKSEEVMCSISSIRPELHCQSKMLQQFHNFKVGAASAANRICCAASLPLTHMKS